MGCSASVGRSATYDVSNPRQCARVSSVAGVLAIVTEGVKDLNALIAHRVIEPGLAQLMQHAGVADAVSQDSGESPKEEIPYVHSAPKLEATADGDYLFSPQGSGVSYTCLQQAGIRHDVCSLELKVLALMEEVKQTTRLIVASGPFNSTPFHASIGGVDCTLAETEARTVRAAMEVLCDAGVTGIPDAGQLRAELGAAIDASEAVACSAVAAAIACLSESADPLAASSYSNASNTPLQIPKTTSVILSPESGTDKCTTPHSACLIPTSPSLLPSGVAIRGGESLVMMHSRVRDQARQLQLLLADMSLLAGRMHAPRADPTTPKTVRSNGANSPPTPKSRARRTSAQLRALGSFKRVNTVPKKSSVLRWRLERESKDSNEKDKDFGALPRMPSSEIGGAHPVIRASPSRDCLVDVRGVLVLPTALLTKGAYARVIDDAERLAKELKRFGLKQDLACLAGKDARVCRLDPPEKGDKEKEEFLVKLRFEPEGKSKDYRYERLPRSVVSLPDRQSQD
eukprot:TRINITY_DN8140_c0_g1_i1.p1 TRINITY_DN8140_c0_g1~~TRINITY_DN8140_c0_g1_i1.p1  ORF type:complete len:514 (+),score=91.05 TRINITY_DN8140_c0_g1_i1:114-1655(+)